MIAWFGEQPFISQWNAMGRYGNNGQWLPFIVRDGRVFLTTTGLRCAKPDTWYLNEEFEARIGPIPDHEWAQLSSEALAR